MKVAVIVPSLRDLAPVQVAIAVAGYLARKGHSVTVYYFKSQFGIKQPENIRFEKISFLRRFYWGKWDSHREKLSFQE